MPQGINSATVIGSGTMGAAIAGHLAGAGIPVTLLDIVPSELTAEEAAAGLTLQHPKVRNRIVQGGFDRMVKAKPANLFSGDIARLIKTGNLEDDFDKAVSQSDWIIEVIVEKPQPKQQLMARIEKVAKSDAIITTNTSGIPIHMISEGRSDGFKKRFMGTHFFNPPRYLHLLEIIPTADTDPALVAKMKGFGEYVLGKGVVICKDSPNFIANRMFSFFHSDLIQFAIDNEYTVEEVDRLTGELLGRPKTGVFRLADVVGIDVAALVGENLYTMIPHDEDREMLKAKEMSAVFKTLIDNKLLGSKTGQGFYKTVTDAQGKKEFLALDLEAAIKGKIEYIAPKKPRWGSVGDARDLPLPERLRSLTNADDAAGELIWHTISQTLAYASKRIPEIADSLADIDNAMKWGFGWEMGPFETWDALGVKETTARMEGEGITVAPWVKEMLSAGHTSFYQYQNDAALVYSPLDKNFVPVKKSDKTLRLADIKRRKAALEENESASLRDMGDGVLLLEFHSKMNTFDPDTFEIIEKAVERLHGRANGLVVGNEGEHFSAGANLAVVGFAAQAGQWDEVERMIKHGQDMFMALRTAPKPVVAAPFNMTLGGGVEVSLASDKIVAHAETYMGLVELGVGLIPGWGGCKEMVRRHVSPHMKASNVNPIPYIRAIFETIATAKVSTSAVEARDLGYLLASDTIELNRDHQLAEAKRQVLAMLDDYLPPVVKGNVYAAGKDVLASTKIEVYGMQQGGFISEYDAYLANKLGYILCGGDLSEPAWMDEQYFLDLERETILHLSGQPKTAERVGHMLQTGKPLRN